MFRVKPSLLKHEKQQPTGTPLWVAGDGEGEGGEGAAREDLNQPQGWTSSLHGSPTVHPDETAIGQALRLLYTGF